MRKTFIFLLLVSIFYSCKKEEVIDAPACIRDDIRDNSSSWTIGKVDEYEFQGELVYVFKPDITIIADGSTEVKDQHCNTVCHFGGYGGPSIMLCNGLHFYSNAVFKRRIWSK